MKVDNLKRFYIAKKRNTHTHTHKIKIEIEKPFFFLQILNENIDFITKESLNLIFSDLLGLLSFEWFVIVSSFLFYER